MAMRYLGANPGYPIKIQCMITFLGSLFVSLTTLRIMLNPHYTVLIISIPSVDGAFCLITSIYGCASKTSIQRRLIDD